MLKFAAATPLLRWTARIPAASIRAERAPIILLYHGVPARSTDGVWSQSFEQHVRFLKQHAQVITLRECDAGRQPSERPRVFLTFDDGFRNNATVVAPILRRHSVPGLFFVASRHSEPGKYLWFSYLRALERHYPANTLSFRGSVFDMSHSARVMSVRRLTRQLLALSPHPTAMYDAIERELPPLADFVDDPAVRDEYAGMTQDQVAELAADPLFDIGAHTVDHPFLSRCDREEALKQVVDNRKWVESATGRACRAIAYPSGDYTTDVIRWCQEAGFTRGYAVASRSAAPSSPFEVSRIGVYAESVDVLAFKVRWGMMLRSLRIPIG